MLESRERLHEPGLSGRVCRDFLSSGRPAGSLGSLIPFAKRDQTRLVGSGRLVDVAGHLAYGVVKWGWAIDDGNYAPAAYAE